MKFVETSISGAFEIHPPVRPDSRGHFVKTFHKNDFAKAGIHFDLRESYYSVSHRNVLRGMHFQTHPHQHAKIVFCPRGKILDVILDLRSDSPSYGRYHAAELSGENAVAIYVPEGCAHGFLTLENQSETMYLVSSEYAPDSDTGVLWNSFGFQWPCEAPILSERDSLFQPFSALKKYF